MDVFEEMFTGFIRSALRVETLPVYKIEGGEWEEFNNYITGTPIKGFANQDWIDDLKSWRMANRRIARIRVIEPNLTDYLVYELEWCFPQNMLAGEEIAIVSKETYYQSVNSETSGDFWMFDEKFVLKMKYDEEGRYLGETLIKDEATIEQHIELFSQLHEASIPLSDILKQLRSTTRRVDIR